jgi:hypothetical protein
MHVSLPNERSSGSRPHAGETIDSKIMKGISSAQQKERAQSHEGSRKVRVRHNNLELNITD